MASTTEIFFPDSLPFPIKVVSLPARAGAALKPGLRLLTYSFLHIPAGNTKDSETRYGSWDATFDGELKSWNVKVGDMVTRQRARDKPALHIIEPCKHGIQFNGLCALCGMNMENFDYTGRSESSRATIQMTHSASGPTVSLEEAQRLERETAEHLLKSRRLSLIVDLDQTIVHATVDPTVGEWISEGEAWEERKARREAKRNGTKEENEEGSDDSSDSDDDEDDEDEVNPNWEALKDVKKFRLVPDTFSSSRSRWLDKGRQKGIQNEGCLYYVKPRPGWQEFLSSVANKYEMHVYTMGTRAYAEEVCAAIDPDGSLFGGRILSRDESGSLTQKSLRRLFPCDTSMVVIIDDRADVWEWCPNLIKVIPYDFFVGIGDINSTFLPKQVDPLKNVPTEQEGSLTDTIASAASSSLPPIPVPSSPELASALSDEDTEATAVEESDENQSAVKTELITQNTLALEAQVEERPLAKKQELLEEEKEEEDMSDQTGDSNSNGTPSEPSEHGKAKHHRKALLKNDDVELTRIGQLLDEVHRRFFEAYENRLPENNLSKRRRSIVQREVAYDVKLIIPNIRMETFKDVHILFSGVIPTNTPVDYESTEVWRMARAFGARCHKDLDDIVTHVVTSKRGTQKVEKARSKGGIYVVWLQWFQDSVAQWRRQDERLYLVDDNGRSTTPQPETASSPPSDPNAVSTDTEPEELVGETEGDGEAETGEISEKELSEQLLEAAGAAEETSEFLGSATAVPAEVTNLAPEDLNLGDVDWQDVNDEVEAAMMESDSEDEERQSSASGRSSNADEDIDIAMEEGGNLLSLPSTPRHERKRLRSLTPSEVSNFQDALRSPLAKRKKIAADRLGTSPLKETLRANDIATDQNTESDSSRPTTPTPKRDSSNEQGDEDEDEESSEGEEIDDDFLARELEEELG